VLIAKAPRSSSPRSHDLNARGRLRVRLGLTSGLPRLAQGRRGRGACRILNRRSQPGRYPLHRFGLSDHLIDVIAIDALKRAQLESDARGFDTRQDHLPQTFGTGVGLNRDGLESNKTASDGMMLRLRSGGSATLSVTGRCR